MTSNIQKRNTLRRVYGVIFLFGILYIGFATATQAFSQGQDAVSKRIMDAKTDTELYPAFEELKGIYFKEHRYAEFVDFLKSLGKKKKTLEPFIQYYAALARYHQLKYLEENQIWDEYFNQGNTYRDEITQGAKVTIDSTTPLEAIHLYARLLLWQFHKDQEDAFVEQALSELMNSVLEYTKTPQEVQPIKAVADKLLSYGEKLKSKELYKIYVQKLVTADIKDKQIEETAFGFYKEGNVDLAATLFDVHISRVVNTVTKEKLIPKLTEIAKLFAYKDEGACDAFYAEKIFQKIEELGGKGIFDESLLYLRAFNSEKAKEYPRAKDCYADLINLYPATVHADEAHFKVGMLYTYVLRDMKSGREYFKKLAQKEKSLSPQVISSLYQLGLLSHWEVDRETAKSYYDKLIVLAGDSYQETVLLARQRLSEIEEGKDIEYGLRTFLDLSLKEEYAIFDMSKVELKTHPYTTEKDKDVNINSTTYTAESGCMQVELQYLWSGHLGKTQPSINQSSFTTSYIHSGTKEINLVVVSSTGIIDRSIDFADVFSSF